MSAEQVRYSVLGPVLAWRGDDELDLGRPKQRAVLAVLLLNANRVVTQSAIVDGVWGEEAPASAVNLVHTYVSRLRRVLEPGRGPREAPGLLAGAPSGYVLRLGAGQLDLDEFHALLSQARAYRVAADLAGAVNAYTAALAMWDGPPLAGIPGPVADTERTRLAELHLATVEDRAEAMLELGRHGGLVGDLSALAAEHPLRERILALLMTALYRCGRQVEALAVYTRTRTLLAGELGIDPGPGLQQLHQRILAGDPVLAAADGASPDAGSLVPRQLPAGSAHFVGRAEQLRRLTALLDIAAGRDETVVISAIDGTAGIGKTALAVQWAHQVADRFSGGQLYANLRGFDPAGAPMHPAEALHGFLEAFGIAPERIPVALDARAALYRSLLAERQVLVVLDNARDAGQVRPLLPGGPACLVVITSRNRLTSLVTAEGAHLLTLDRLSSAEATALLTRHLGAYRVAAEPQAVKGLIDSCARLPLALGIAAARAAAHPGFPLAVLAAELRQAPARLDALDAGEPYANLRTVLSWSVDALEPQTAAVFGLLGVAPGPDISLPAAASLIAQPLTRTRRLLRALENAHLLQQPTPDRYRMHDLIRLYAAEYADHTQPQGSREAALRRLADFYTHTAHTGERLLAPHRPQIGLGDPVPGCHPFLLTEQAGAWAWFDSEHPCLLATQELAIRLGWHTTVWQLAWTLTTFHRRQGRLHDQVAAWRAGLAAADHLSDPAAHTLAHLYFGEACAWAGDHDEGLYHLYQALTLAKDTGDVSGQALTHNALTGAWERQGDDQRALDHATHALHLYQALGDRVLEARALGDMGWYYARLGHHDQARAHCAAALTLHREHHDREAVGATLDSLGYIAHHAGHHQQALGYYHQALAVYRDLGDSYQEAEILNCLAHTHVALGQHEQARDVWKHVLELYQAQHRTTNAERTEKQLATLDEQPPNAK